MNDKTENVLTLATTGRSDVTTAEELKARMEQAMRPVLAIMDEAVTHGMAIQFDGIQRTPPYYAHAILGLRVVKQIA